METKVYQKIKQNHFETSSELAEVKVSYRSGKKSKIKITHSKDVFSLLYPLYDKNLIEYQEFFYLLLLNGANNFLGWIKLSSGGTTSTVVDIKMVFTIALQTNAKGIVLSHNHTSGNLIPSSHDKDLTKKVQEASHLLDIKLLDHIIVSPDEEYYSFADEGILF